MLDQFGRWFPDFPGQQPFQDPMYIRNVSQAQAGIQPAAAAASQQAAPTLTPPTIHAEIVQVDDETAVDRYPVAAGASQMFITKDDKLIIVKTMLANGQFTKDYYDRRPPAPPAPVFDPAAYVRRDEISELVSAAIVATHGGSHSASGKEASIS